MATMDIFEGDAFTIVELTRALENIPTSPRCSRARTSSAREACARAPS
ncbi:hypothetical protein FLP41_14180 [Paracoccus marcusii]|nr:hypothetical protein FLP41_14180 [Paracoccus marcusii]